MNHHEWANTVERVVTQALQNLRRDGELMPILVVDGDQAILVPLVDFGATIDDREARLRTIGTELRSRNPSRAAVIADSYWRPREEDEHTIERSLADDPRAAEAVVVVQGDGRVESSITSYPYVRTPRLTGLEISFEEPQSSGAEGNPLLVAFFDGVRGQ